MLSLFRVSGSTTQQHYKKHQPTDHRPSPSSNSITSTNSNPTLHHYNYYNLPYKLDDDPSTNTHPLHQLSHSTHSRAELLKQRSLFDAVATQLGINSLDDWYRITKNNYKKYSTNNSSSTQQQLSQLVTSLSHTSLSRALQTVYPEHNWKPWKFGQVPKGHWFDFHHHRSFFDGVAVEANISHPIDWYTIKKSLVEKIGGKGVLTSYYNDSLITALQHVYPEYEWNDWQFEKASKGYWITNNNGNRRREYLDQLGHSVFGITSFEDWYKVESRDIQQQSGARGFISTYYNDSLPQALEELYPEYHWNMWKFATVPKRYWKNESNQKEFVRWLTKQLNIHTPEDWKGVSIKQIASLGGLTLLQNNGGLLSLLCNYFPGHPWDKVLYHSYSDKKGRNHRYSSSQSKSQSHLFKLIEELFPQYQIYSNHPITNNNNNNNTGKDNNRIHTSNSRTRNMKYSQLELDIYIPSLQLAIEYQGEQHFQSYPLFGSLSLQQHRDEEKRKVSSLSSLLIVLPYFDDSPFH